MEKEKVVKSVLYQEGGFVSPDGEVRSVGYNPEEKSEFYFFVVIEDYPGFYLATIETGSGIRRELISDAIREFEAIRRGVELADSCRVTLFEIAKNSGQNE